MITEDYGLAFLSSSLAMMTKESARVQLSPAMSSLSASARICQRSSDHSQWSGDFRPQPHFQFFFLGSPFSAVQLDVTTTQPAFVGSYIRVSLIFLSSRFHQHSHHFASLNTTMSALDQIKNFTTVVSDTGDFECKRAFLTRFQQIHNRGKKKK